MFTCYKTQYEMFTSPQNHNEFGIPLICCHIKLYNNISISPLPPSFLHRITINLIHPFFTGGVFVVLLCGLALAVVVAILEFCWNSKKNSQVDRQSLCSEMAEELRFAMHCHGSKQRPALKRTCHKCVPSSTYVPADVIALPEKHSVNYNYH